MSALRTILAIAARIDWDINVFDFHGAFLNGEFDDKEKKKSIWSNPGLRICGSPQVRSIRTALWRVTSTTK
jgi:hypothetical protein